MMLGKLFTKNDDTDSWDPFIFELQPDRLYRRPLSSHLGEHHEYCHLHACFVKKFNHQDSKMPGFKSGIRLQMGDNLSDFVADQADTFKKWYRFRNVIW